MIIYISATSTTCTKIFWTWLNKKYLLVIVNIINFHVNENGYCHTFQINQFSHVDVIKVKAMVLL